MRYLRLLLFAIPVTLALMLSAAAWFLWPRTAITPENAAKIKIGMTLAEVEAILGGAARDETTGPVKVHSKPVEVDIDFLYPWPDPWTGPRPRVCTWRSDRATVDLSFAPDGRLLASKHCEMRPVPQSFLDRIRAWLHL
jgi:hypothetical protein